jgi:glycosyltransferase involved in cell wall biosynthesis
LCLTDFVGLEYKGIEKMKPHILVITFEGLLSPVFQNQFAPVLSALSTRYKFTILLVEKHDAFRCKLIDQERDKLAELGIHAISLPLLRLPFKLTLLVNAFIVLFYTLLLVPVKKIDIVHIRRYDSIVVALLLKFLYQIRVVFDPRGLFVDEKISAGRWSAGGYRVSISRLLEKKILEKASAVIAFSHPHSEFVKNFHQRMVESKVTLIPNCVDLKKFSPRPRYNRKSRSKDGLVLIYVGGASYWHMIDEMIFFFKHLKERIPTFFMYLTYEDRDEVVNRFNEAGIQPRDYCITSVPPEKIAQHLTRADIGIALIEPSLAKKVCAPIKFVEYLASGLPVVINRGIGETEQVIEKYCVGVIYDRKNVDKRITELLTLLKSEDIYERCRSVVERHYNLDIAIDRLSSTYQRIL